ncbi:hypothetical protein PG993_002531 [Apiospora rasikravindrae]|uniref:DUF5753 domain-containing protein n=1 Tax=Apiospora rasikravindrae TaxID=990691 RepID=A0ABR1TWX7_9PEZI
MLAVLSEAPYLYPFTPMKFPRPAGISLGSLAYAEMHIILARTLVNLDVVLDQDASPVEGADDGSSHARDDEGRATAKQ